MIQQPTAQTHCTTPLLTDVQGLHQDHDNYYYSLLCHQLVEGVVPSSSAMPNLYVYNKTLRSWKFREKILLRANVNRLNVRFYPQCEREA